MTLARIKHGVNKSQDKIMFPVATLPLDSTELQVKGCVAAGSLLDLISPSPSFQSKPKQITAVQVSSNSSSEETSGSTCCGGVPGTQLQEVEYCPGTTETWVGS